MQIWLTLMILQEKKKSKLTTKSWSSIQNINNWRLWIPGSGSRKTNALLNLSSDKPDTDNLFYAKDSYKAKYQLLINKREGVELKHYNDSKAFIEYSNDLSIKILQNATKVENITYIIIVIVIVFDDMIADMLNNAFQEIANNFLLEVEN